MSMSAMAADLPRSPQNEAAPVGEPLRRRRERAQLVPAQVELLERGRVGELVGQRREAIGPQVEDAEARDGGDGGRDAWEAVGAQVKLPQRSEVAQRLRQLRDPVSLQPQLH